MVEGVSAPHVTMPAWRWQACSANAGIGCNRLASRIRAEPAAFRRADDTRLQWRPAVALSRLGIDR
jgi:hypothetical protein